MNIKHILIPLDLMRSPCDALVFARNMAADSPVCVTLLYVLNLNIVSPGRRIYDELCMESEAALRKLARFFFGTDRAARIVVRVGLPHEEIVAEAKAESSDLIILSGSGTPHLETAFAPGHDTKNNRRISLPRHSAAAPPENDAAKAASCGSDGGRAGRSPIAGGLTPGQPRGHSGFWRFPSPLF